MPAGRYAQELDTHHKFWTGNSIFLLFLWRVMWWQPAADQTSKTIGTQHVVKPFRIGQFWRNWRLVKKSNSQIQHRSALLVLGVYCSACLKRQENDDWLTLPQNDLFTKKAMFSTSLVMRWKAVSASWPSNKIAETLTYHMVAEFTSSQKSRSVGFGNLRCFNPATQSIIYRMVLDRFLILPWNIIQGSACRVSGILAYILCRISWHTTHLESPGLGSPFGEDFRTKKTFIVVRHLRDAVTRCIPLPPHGLGWKEIG